VALDLENKRKDLEKVKDRLKDKIVNVGRERNKLAAEKDKVDVLRREAEDKLNDLSQKNSQQDALIEQQKDIIKKQEQIIEEARNNNQANLVAPEKVADPKAKDAKTPIPQKGE
jgi:chromosome segregation ATPase